MILVDIAGTNFDVLCSREYCATFDTINQCYLFQPCDNEERVREAVARTLMFAVMAEEDNIDEWLNPTEVAS